jgi:hypothetical protein
MEYTNGKEKCLRKFASKPEGKRPLRRTIRRWEDLKEIVRGHVGWIRQILCEDW